MSSKEAKAAYDRARRAAKREQLAAYDKERNARRRADPEYAAAQLKRKQEWRKANPEKYLASQRLYENTQRATNPQWRLAKNLRHRLGKAMMGKTKGVSAVRDLGISIPEFREYIENQFQDGMTWDNYGEWHIDHIIPLISFDLTDKEQALKACHYTNLQPLWAKDNLSKGGKPHRDKWDANYDAALAAVI